MNKISVTKIIYLGLSIRILVAFINAFITPTPGGGEDALGFHFVASEFAQTGDTEIYDLERIGWYYSLFLGYIYRYTIDSIFVGSLISIVAWFFAAILMLKILDFIKTSKTERLLCISIYSFWPTSIFYTSLTLRESFQLLLLTASIYYMFKFFFRNFGILNLITALLAGAALSLLHSSLIIVFIAIIFSFILFKAFLQSKQFFASIGTYFILILITIIAPAISSFISAVSYSFENGLFEAIISYNEGLINDAEIFRARYRDAPPDSSFVGFATYPIIAFFQYNLEPMLWKIATPQDLLLSIENFARALIYITSIIFIFSNNFRENIHFVLILLICFLVEGVWSLGTINWGTASRHHIPAMALISILGISLLRLYISRNQKNKTNIKPLILE